MGNYFFKNDFSFNWQSIENPIFADVLPPIGKHETGLFVDMQNMKKIECTVYYNTIESVSGFTIDDVKKFLNGDKFPREVEDYRFVYGAKDRKLYFYYTGIGNFSVSKGSTVKPTAKNMQLLTKIKDFANPVILVTKIEPLIPKVSNIISTLTFDVNVEVQNNQSGFPYKIHKTTLNVLPTVTDGIASDLPPVTPGAFWLVNGVVFNATDRKDFIMFDPAETVRDETGKAIAQGGYIGRNVKGKF